jgi:hypothetical protein
MYYHYTELFFTFNDSLCFNSDSVNITKYVTLITHGIVLYAKKH